MHQLNLFDSYTKSLEELYSKVHECKLCGYHRINESRVNGKGNVGAPVMIVGQGPGPVEMDLGEPYVGASGKLLRTILRKVGIPIADVYLTNLIRCIQPAGKNIMVKAIRLCGGWLADEVNLVRPRLVVCLGGLAAKHIAGVDSIGENSGKILDSIYGIPAIGTVHTAYLLRLRSNYKDRYLEVSREAYEHWQTIAEVYKSC